MHLHLREYHFPSQWRWQLDDAAGNFLADHEVRLDERAAEYRGFTDLPGYLTYYGGADEEIRPHADLLEELGAWLGVQVFGGLRAKLLDQQTFPATPVHVHLPPEAQHLVQAPLELAHLDGQPLARQGIRFIYRVEAGQHATAAKPADGPLRVLAVFSLPDDASPLNLRRERYQLKQLLDTLATTHNLGLELRVLQYGATRTTLEAALKDGRGWDLIHFSGHGHKGLLALEDTDGHADRIETEDLKRLLRLAKRRLKLLTLSACHSGANLERADPLAPPLRAGGGPAVATVYPSLAQTLAEELDCAVLAMRYSVGDDFATELGLALYRGLLENHQPLPGALQLALDEGLKRPAPLESIATPILFGARAADLGLAPPSGDGQLQLDSAGLGHPFPPEPERFVGRLALLLKANAALAPAARMRGVLFHGMAGAGKTASALELAWRHERARFTYWAWYKAPDQDSDVSDSLRNCLVSLEHQLGLPPGDLIEHLLDPELFKARTLPKLSRLLGQRSLCLCLDNLEGLLSAGGEWRVPLWGELLAALLNHTGQSRVILTSRRLPRALADHPALLRLPVHALSLREANLLLREMEHTAPLFADAAGRQLLHRLLAVVQGHPKLLELADRFAADRSALAARLEDEVDSPEVRDFFATGESTRDEADFVAQLGNWAEAAYRGLDARAQRLLLCLARMEEDDRNSHVLAAVWGVLMEGDDPDALEPGLQALARAGLIELHSVEAGSISICTLHPAIAERLRSLAEPKTLARVDQVLGDFWTHQFRFAEQNEIGGLGSALATSARHALPYLVQQEEWVVATYFLEQLLIREQSPVTLAFVLNWLERIGEATVGTKLEIKVQGTLANALLYAGRYEEAEKRLRQGVLHAASKGDWALASAMADTLLDVYRTTGDLQQALDLAKDMADYSRRAGLGPWTQLSDDVRHLQVLNAQGDFLVVLDRVMKLLSYLKQLPERGDALELVSAWYVHETLLHTGVVAASQLKLWEQALGLNDELLHLRQERGADAMKLAETCFSDYSALLHLGRHAECRSLLESCREVFARHHDIAWLGKAYTALANLESEEEHISQAIQFQRGALKYFYMLGQRNECAVGHHNLANHLERSEAPTGEVLAHFLAATVIWHQTGSGQLWVALHNRRNSDLQPKAPSFAEVAETVEKIEGVRFRELFATLPANAPDGDAAIVAVWKRMHELKEATQQFTTSLPPELLAALEAGDEASFNQALGQLPSAQQATIFEQIMSALPEELLGQLAQVRKHSDMERTLYEWAPLLQAIAAVAQGDEELRPALEELLPQLEAKGWRLSAPVHTLWSGERDPDRLTTGLDESDSQIVRHILGLLGARDVSL